MISLFIKHFIWKPFIDDSLISLVESYMQPNAHRPSFIIMGMGTVCILNLILINSIVLN